MFALFASILGYLMVHITDYGPFNAEDPMLRGGVYTLAIEGLARQQNAAEQQCSAGCADGTLTLTSPPAVLAVSGTYGTVVSSGNVISFYAPTVGGPIKSTWPFFNPDIVTDTAMRSTFGRYSATTNVATGFSTMVMPTMGAVPAMSLAIPAALSVPDGAIVVASHR